MAQTSAAAAADCVGVFKYVPNDRLSIQELSAVAGSESKEGPNSTILITKVTDYEDPADRGPWMLWGVVYGAFLGEGGKVVGGTLWVKNREVFGTAGGGTFRAAKDGVRLTILPVIPIKGCKAGFTFRLDSQGRLLANGALAGRAKSASEP
ncbi:MAG: hypothetical protein JWP49_2025 [Phenylobacterium sp.]|nr:hypothetical protein [Phenylobacterium sp.]